MMCNIDLKRYLTAKLALLVYLHVENGPVKKGGGGVGDECVLLKCIFNTCSL